MSYPSGVGSPGQFRSLVRSMLISPHGLFELLLSAEHTLEVLAENVHNSCERIFTPLVTLMTLLGQVLAEDQSCRAAVARLLAWRVARGLAPCSTATGGYGRARQRLSESILPELVRHSADQLRLRDPDSWQFHGRTVVIADGTTVSMPDTPDNQAAYPQHTNQKPGCGFPLARLVVLLSLATGAAIDAAIGPCKGKESGETTLLRGLRGRLSGGDILLADRLFCTYLDIALLMAQGVDVVFRNPTTRRVDFRSGCRIGHDDHTVTWTRPVRPDWMDPATYATIPETLEVRQLRVRIGQRGFRTRTLVVVTTLLEAASFSRAELAGLYRMRWHAELDIRSIKQTMKMDVLRCKTPEMVGKEIWAHLLVYNLVRGVMAEAARSQGVSPRGLSLQGARQLLVAFQKSGGEGETTADQVILEVLLNAIGRERVGDRPDRYEPRVRKRRPKPYPLMQEPRSKARKRMERAA